MEKNEFSSFRELRENMNRLMHSLLKNAQSPESKELNLNDSQIQVILLLKKFNLLKMSDLTNHTNVVKSSMTNIIDSLENLKLVDRVRNDKDRRIIYVELTKKGNDLAVSLRHSVFSSFEKRVNCLSIEDREYLFKSIDSVSSLISKMENKSE